MKVKRLIGLILAVVSVLLCLGCQPGEQSSQVQATGFRVGYAKEEITPKESVPLRGYGNPLQRMSQGSLDRLYVTCVAVSDDQDNTVLIMGLDLTTSKEKPLKEIRTEVSLQTGIPENQIMFCASHSHSAPDTESTSSPEVNRYLSLLKEKLPKAALAALADRKSAQMQIGSVEVVGQSFTRHYVLEDGTQVGYETLVTAGVPVAHVGTPDYTMQLVKFVRNGGKDVVVVNWQAHPTRASADNKFDASADIVGVIRDELAAAWDCEVAYIQGAAGNMNAESMIASEKVSANYQEQGKTIASFAINAGEELFKPVQTGAVKLLHYNYVGQVDHTMDHLLEYAKTVQKIWTSTNDRKAADAAGVEYGIRSPYHANKIVTMTSYEETEDINLTAFSIGDVAFVTAPYEMFSDVGLHIKEGSPFAMTVIAGYTNGHVGYIPSVWAFNYEAYEVDITHFIPGTAEDLGEKLIDMLEQLNTTP